MSSIASIHSQSSPMVAMCAVIATAFVGSSRETNDAPGPVQSAVSTPAQP